jgi:hypothetical protein
MWLDLSDLESMDQWKRGSPEHHNKPLNKIQNEKFVDQLFSQEGFCFGELLISWPKFVDISLSTNASFVRKNLQVCYRTTFSLP